MNDKHAGVYLRPGGLLGANAAREAVEQGKAGRIAGGWAAFSLIEVVQREGSRIQRDWHCWADIAASQDGVIAGLLEKIASPRRPVAGLSMAEPQIMGIVNVTPDSFSDGGKFLNADAAITHGKKLHQDGAGILDIGGESTRPGAAFVSDQIEADRVVPVLEGLADTGAVLSVDTRKPAVMNSAFNAGARFINDVTALSFAPDSLKTASTLALPVCLMHLQGSPETMQHDPQYGDVVLDVYDYLARRIVACENAGIANHQIVVDPGIGFGKTVHHNLALIDQIALFHGLGVPILLGASRKSFIGQASGNKDAGQRLPGSLAAALAGLQSGVQILRVHDVAETRQAVRIWASSAISP